MPPRLTTRPTRDNDFSDVGKIGRRTGVTLAQGRLDVNGMEEISGIFSSPRKPSPLRKSISVVDSIEGKGLTPTGALSARRSLPPPRSTSPRKSGISGTAKRSKVVDVLGLNKGTEVVVSTQDNSATAVDSQSPVPSTSAKRFSPERTPLKNVPSSRLATAHSTRSSRRNQTSAEKVTIEIVETSAETSEEPVDAYKDIAFSDPIVDTSITDHDYILPTVEDDVVDDQVSITDTQEDEVEEPVLPPPMDDEDADQTFEPGKRLQPRSREPTVANSRRKRKSDAMDHEGEIEAISSPAAKRAKRISDQTMTTKKKDNPKTVSTTSAQPRKRGKPPLKNKDTNVKLSASQQGQLDEIIEKVKPRPGQKKTLHILRRETPANDGVVHTRSGRISVKPLAYWRNERCVFGGSPGGVNLNDGARFPLNSIKEIIRMDEVSEKRAKNGKRLTKGKAKSTARSQSFPADEDDEEESESESDVDEVDPEAEPWEVERGIFRGPVGVWDAQKQTPVDWEEEMDIAYAPASIETREVKGSTFRYAKLLSSKFFGSGIVDLPVGGIKKTKNSRRMHMSFFVATGRVTVQVGPQGGTENRFSIGKGGWWQVPRGNQYSIENQHTKPARVFFSQACEPAAQGEDA